VQCRTTHQVSREVSIPDPDVNLDLVAFLMFLPFFAFRCECFWSMLKAPRFDLHVYQQYRGLHHHPRNETTLSPVVNTPASKQARKSSPGHVSQSHLLQPTKPTLLTPTSLPRVRKSVSSASDPASRLLQPGCNMNTRQQGVHLHHRRTTTSSNAKHFR
jgi:hypothetical protein